MKSRQTILKNAFTWIIKIAIVIAAAFYIYQKVVQRASLSDFRARFIAAFFKHPYLFLIVIILMLINWSLEAFKWKMLLSRLQAISFPKALRGILAGITTGVFTPNRVGEFGGRVFSLHPGLRVQAALLSFAGGFMQLLVTVLMAIPALFLIETSNRYAYSFPRLIPVLLCFFLLIPLLIRTFRDKIRTGARKYYGVLQDHPTDKWLLVFILSLFRYFVFSLQFVLLLNCFDICLPLLPVSSAIALVFFATSVIPTFALSEIGIRGSVSVIFIGIYSNDSTGIIAASFLLWIINIAVPALCGGIFVLSTDPYHKTA